LIVVVSSSISGGGVVRVFKISVALISIYNINFIIYSFGMPSFEFLIGWDEYEALGVHSGYLQLNNQNIASLIFISPFLISYFLIKGVKNLTRTDLLVMIFLIVNILISGRRALLFITLLAIPMTYILLSIVKGDKLISLRNIKRTLFVMVLIYCLIELYLGVFEFDQKSLLDRLTFQNSESDGLIKRVDGSIYLINEAYKHNIFFGMGGGGLPFEIKYILILNQTGLIGSFIYMTLLALMPIRIIFLIKKRKLYNNFEVPLIVGYISFLIGDAINPLSGSFDFMWMLFTPIFLIYHALRK
jgi:hypothetical protein